KDGTVWVGTYYGLLRKESKTGNEHVFVHDPHNSTSLSNNIVYDIKPDGSGGIWIATNGGGLDRFDPTTNQFTHHHFKAIAQGGDSINVLYPGTHGNFWVGTLKAGVIKMDKRTGKA